MTPRCTFASITPSSGEEINRLEQEIRRLRETRFAQGGTDEAKLSTRMHIWLENNLDTTLHHLRNDFVGDGLHRFCFKNQTKSLDDFQRVKGGLATFLSVPIEKIEQNFDEGSIEITVRLARKTVVKEEDINRLCRSDKQYLERSTTWARVQFLAPSETGKTSSSEILGYQFTRAKGGQIYFHFPNENSAKNYVVSPIASKGTDDCIESFASLVRRVDNIQNGVEDLPGSFEYHIFDDSDSVIAQAIREGLTRQEILDFFTRASHCRIGFCLIGHSTAANNFPGFTHSDFNNLVRVYAGTDIMTALQNTQIISEDRAKSLRTQYEKIRDYFESKNKDLGLVTAGDSADPQAYRFALVVEPNARPYFCQLPRLDKLSNTTLTLSDKTDGWEQDTETLSSQSRSSPKNAEMPTERRIASQLSSQSSNQTYSDQTPTTSQPSPTNKSSNLSQDEALGRKPINQPTKKQPKTRGVCPICQSSETVRNGNGKGMYKGMQQFLCRNPEHPEGKTRTFYHPKDGQD